MVLGTFGLKPVVNCQLTLVVDHFFPKRNNSQKIVYLVLELGLAVPVPDLVSGPIKNLVPVLEPGLGTNFCSRIGSSIKPGFGFQFQKSRAGSDLVRGNWNQTNDNLRGQTR
jgi:hypothetical protein